MIKKKDEIKEEDDDSLEYKFINLNKNKIIYSSSDNEYDIMIIRLQNGKIKDYLEIDDNIFENSEQAYKNELIYILHYPGKDKKAQISYSEKGIEKLDEYDIKHYCSTYNGSSGSPILSAATNEIIGIHRGTYDRKKGKEYNYGTFLKYPLNELKKNIHKTARNKNYNKDSFLKNPFEGYISNINDNKTKNEIICIYNKQKDEINLLHDYSDNMKYWPDLFKKPYIEGKNNINENNIL